MDQTLQQFLKNEDVPTTEKTSPKNLECERIYQLTTTRQLNDRYVVH